MCLGIAPALVRGTTPDERPCQAAPRVTLHDRTSCEGCHRSGSRSAEYVYPIFGRWDRAKARATKPDPAIRPGSLSPCTPRSVA
jgi:hypothetical protein